jgi:hypothetical protein
MAALGRRRRMVAAHRHQVQVAPNIDAP